MKLLERDLAPLAPPRLRPSEVVSEQQLNFSLYIKVMLWIFFMVNATKDGVG